jgi:catechol 2,3-dioxygenase-like lactoylglutathione lyase family enzyme
MIEGINHVTLSVSDLERSFRFYVEILGLRPIAKWVRGAYLLAGNDWICLSLDDKCRKGQLPEYTHLAFSISSENFGVLARFLIEMGWTQWQEDKSEGDSLYILDPDSHKLEIHVGNLESRLAALQNKPYEGLVLFG